jgi:hypothetical protein
MNRNPKRQINHESTKTRNKKQYKFRAFKISCFRGEKVFA